MADLAKWCEKGKCRQARDTNIQISPDQQPIYRLFIIFNRRCTDHSQFSTNNMRSAHSFQQTITLFSAHSCRQMCRLLTVFSMCRSQTCTTAIWQLLSRNIKAPGIAVNWLQQIDFQHFPAKYLRQFERNFPDSAVGSSYELTCSIVLL